MSMGGCKCLDCNDPLQGQFPIVEIPEGATQQDTAPGQVADKMRVLALGLVLTGGFSGIEWTAGWWSHSLALVGDAGHMLSDCSALGLSLGATALAQIARHHPWLRSGRAEILAALANGVGLMILALWIGWEAVHRFSGSHPAVITEVMLVTALIGLGLNTLAASVLHPHSHEDLNLRGAFLHVLADTASSIGVIMAAVLIWGFHWPWADTAISLGIATLIGLSSLPLVQASLVALSRASVLPPDS